MSAAGIILAVELAGCVVALATYLRPRVTITDTSDSDSDSDSEGNDHE